MNIFFYVGFRSEYGQSVNLKLVPYTKGGKGKPHIVPLEYLDEDFWTVTIDIEEFEIKDEFEYSYLFIDEKKGERKAFCINSFVSLKKADTKNIVIIDEWSDDLKYADVFSSRPFANVFQQHEKEKIKIAGTKNPSHVFRVKAPAIAPGNVVCITGAGKKLKDWDIEQPLCMDYKKGEWVLKLNLNKESFPLEYKLGIYNIKDGEMTFEPGSNRVLPEPVKKNTLTFVHQTLQLAQNLWKGAGINVPVSALKTKESWGVGEFTDLNLLVDFAKATGLSLIQLLPVNDTTATHTNKDSYPYSAISAFALHPIFLNIPKIARDCGISFPEVILEQVEMLNASDSLHYEEVSRLKQSAIKALYESDNGRFKDDFGWFDFFEMNRHWLVPYAAFSYLRDQNKTADFYQWGAYANYDEHSIQELVSPEHDFYDDIAIHYFIQYHLHLQLTDAVDYAHKSGICIKGDLPIGVGRCSVDSWMYRDLFYMDMQAGAPPDLFATRGQNWSFPTYNWHKMAEANYAWWRQRMEHMSRYFDAIRIDHVLGFFRIWSIPYDEVEGIMGRFIPAWPLHRNEFVNAGIHFSESRFCKPYITEQVLYDWFGVNAGLVKDIFMDRYQFKPEFDTQRKVKDYLLEHPEHAYLQQGLFDLLSNIIAIPDEEMPDHFHLRISLHDTSSYNDLSQKEKHALDHLFDEYFFNKQNNLWEEEGVQKLTALKSSTNMLICAEDLGMVPQMVERVLQDMQMLSLEVQRMPKKMEEKFSNPLRSNYLSVVTPSTHDMATVREWWEEDLSVTRQFYHEQLGQVGDAPFYAEPWVCREILQQHLQSPAMWAIFLMQDMLAIDDKLRKSNPKEERINIPADPEHYWNYRMHISMEELLEQAGFIVTLKNMVQDSGR